MTRHYSRFDYRCMETQTLLASDPVTWRRLEAVLTDTEGDR